MKIIVFSIIIISTLNCFAQHWDSVSAKLNFPVYSLTHSNNKLYVGKGYNPSGHYIEIWDGTKWDSLGIDCDGQVRWMLFYRGKLTASAVFQGISQWNDTNWVSLGNAGTTCYNFYVHDSTLYAIYPYDSLNGLPPTDLAIYDGTNWVVHDTTRWVSGDILCAIIYKNELYIGGNFVNWDNTISYFAKWDGSQWQQVGNINVQGGGIDNLIEYKGCLYVSGLFSAVGFNGKAIIKWDGNNWSDLGDGIQDNNAHVQTMIVYDSLLVVGGVFYNVAGIPASNLAAWNGTQWCVPNDIFNNRILCLDTMDGKLYIGGGFTKINNDTIKYLAYTKNSQVFSDSCTAVNISEIINENSFVIYSNPTSGICKVKGRIIENKNNVNIILSELTGRILLDQKLKITDKTVEMNLEEFENGFYLISIISNGVKITNRILMNK